MHFKAGIRTVERWLHVVMLSLLLAFLSLTYPDMGKAYWWTIYYTIAFDFTIFAGCAYFAAYSLLPRFFLKRRYFLFFSYFLISLVAGSLLILFNDVFVNYINQDISDFVPDLQAVLFFSSTLAMIFMISVVGVAIRGFILWVQSMEQLHVIQQEKLKTELAFLRSQMNPHFLFNTINLVFGNIEKTNSTARDIMVRFSELLRYQLYECDVAEIPLEKEINYLKNYIELQRKRKADELSCTLRLPEKVEGYNVSPLLMAPLVENAFKYVGSNGDKEHYLYIELKQVSSGLVFTCVNTKSSLVYKDLNGAHGLGLQNLRRRLELLYPDKHKLQIKESDKIFDVQLSLSL